MRAAAAVVLVVPTAAIIIILGASRHRQHHDSREQPREEAGRGDALANATAAATAGHNGWCDLFAGLPVLPWRLRYSRGMVYLTAGGGEGPVSSVSSGSSVLYSWSSGVRVHGNAAAEAERRRRMITQKDNFVCRTPAPSTQNGGFLEESGDKGQSPQKGPAGASPPHLSIHQRAGKGAYLAPTPRTPCAGLSPRECC